ncbi:MAG TPA: hypothetical protein PLY93_07750, partial [Turneriella sp.]|nr:hypothetical protein [Turneriella sp.]
LEHAKHHLVALWDFDSIKPGSYTYHHFWIRDAVIMMYALLLVGAKHAVKPILERFTGLVKRSGLFRSQSGEWDANGQALWILAQYARLTQDTSVIDSMKKHITRMLSWYEKTLAHHGGVLPPGFSAEHLGPADWYLWDNFWALGGLKEIAPYLNDAAMVQRATTIYKTLSMRLGEYLNSYPYLPAALGRSKDAGMIGSIIVGYPLQVTDFLDARYLDSLDIIHKNYFFQGCFFQENIHSGLNPYLTLQMAESYLFVGKTGAARKILRNIKRRAQKAYSYPEAIHVRTGGGCMGDGFHGWASAEAVIMIRNLVVREVTLKTKTSALVWLAGYREKWLYEKSYVENIYTQHSHATLTLSDCHLTLENISMKETHILSLPQGFVPVDTTTNKALPYFAHENFIPVADTERNYFLLDKDDGKKTTLHLAKP